jgi:hypothetical protein
MGQILASGLPFKMPDDCGNIIEINCDGNSGNSDPSSNYDVVFPVGSGASLPLSGGAIVKLDFSALPIKIEEEVLSLLIKEVKALNGSFSGVKGLVDARIIINSIIHSIGKSGALSGLPSVTICTMSGDDSSLDKQKANANINKICAIKYIPVEVLEAIGLALSDLESSGGFGDSSSPIYGATGLKFSDYGSIKNEDLAIASCIDLLPFYNIPEKNIVKRKGASPTGGYFTIVNNDAFLKIPDLTGRDSSGFNPDLWSEEEERNLYIEILNEAKLTRITITEIDAPPAAIVADYNKEFPDSSDLEIELDTSSEIEKAYLSLIISEVSAPKINGIREFDNGIELATIPLLTKPIFSKLGGKNGTFKYKDEDSFDSDTLSKYITDDIELIASDGFNGEYGVLSTDPEIPLDYVYGEQNRPEILLSNRSKERSNRANNRRYKNDKMTRARPLFAQTRPRLYEALPFSWIEGTISTAGGVTKASFPASKLAFIKRDEKSKSTEFALYLRNKSQVVRVPGQNISLETISPVITKISPHGFIGSTEPIEFNTSIRITGDDLGGVNEIILKDSIGEYRFNTLDYPDMRIVPTAKMVILEFGADAYVTLTQNSRYELSVGTSRGAESKPPLPIYISLAEDAIPYPSDLRASFSPSEFTPDKSTNPGGIPLLSDGQSVEIKIRSKSKLFSGDYPIFAYFGLPNSPENLAIMNEFDIDVKKFTSEDILVASSLEWELKQSLFEDFAARNKRKAVIKFPGSSYYEHNFSKLMGIKEAKFLILNDSMSNLAGDKDEISLSSDKFGIITLGGGTSEPDEKVVPAFIAPGHITAVIAEVGEDVISTVRGIESKIISDSETVGNLFSNKAFKTGGISVFRTVPKLAIIFAAADMPFMRKRYDFILDGKSIKSSLVDSIRMLDNETEAIAVFRNVSSKSEGNLGLGIKVKDKRFNVTYDSSTVYGSVTGSVTSEGFSVDPKTKDLTLSSELPTEGISSFVNDESYSMFHNAFTNLVESSGNGVIISVPGALGDFSPYNPISITSKQGDITLKTKSAGDSIFSNSKIIANSVEDDIISISKTEMSVPVGAPYKKGQYLLDKEEASAIIFNRIGIKGGAGIGFNIPEIIGMSTDRGSLQDETIPTSLPVNEGDKVYVRVKNVKRNFSIKIGSAVVKAVSATRVGKGVYDAQFVVPGSLIGFITADDCMIICASSVNADRLKAKKILGSTFVTNIEKKMEELIFGKLKDKIPDIDDLKALLCKVPLRFMSMDLCDVSIPTELINSFCDLSFHLLADLKIALNGFQVLMIPIQVIFCIIDVLCALLNPVKTAQAMIRLFECLFDLVLLLPQISVPVMFLKLILHLLELLECVIDKILGIIIAVNAIVPAMEAALKNKDWASLKALEEVLSEYLFDLNVDLDILAPVISILTIFLQLLQLVFRFPCQVTPADNAGACSIDGSMLAGIVGGVVAPESAIVPDHLIPVGQVYTNQTLEEAAASGTSAIVLPSAGDIIARKSSTDNLYVTDMEVDPDSLRATNSSLGFLASMAISATKSRKAFKNPAEVEFQFKSRYEPGFIIRSKLFDPTQSGDSPLMLTEEAGTGLMKIASGTGNFVSPIDGLKFMTKRNGLGSIKTLEQEIQLPIYEVNEDTSQLEEVGVERVWKTFDGIPMMTILDEEFNLYFINDDGVEFDDDGNVASIKATMVNSTAAPKLRFGREETEIDSNGDGEVTEDDESVKVYDFPQLYFVDMRSCVDTINSFCSGASLNSFLLEEDNSDDVSDIVDEAKGCLEGFMSTVKGFGADMRKSMNEGNVPEPISLDKFQAAVGILKECLNGAADKMCVYVVNTLTTSFKVEGDVDLTPSEKYLVPSLNSDDLEDLGFEENPPSVTGASEYAEGDGDSAIFGLGELASIMVTPRDAMDLPLGGDLTDKIVLEIVSDTTGDAEFVLNDEDKILTLDGESYFANLTSNKEGEVKLRVKVCNRTIQAITYDGLDDINEDKEVDCIDDATKKSINGSLIKVDRIVTVIFVRKSTARLTDGDDPATLAQPQPQQFGTSLEN